MNIQKFLYNTFCTTTESMLFDRIHLANAIEKYANGEFALEHADEFESCVQQIVSGKLTRYNFREEYVKKLFKFSSDAKCRLYLDLMSYEAGVRLSADSEKHSLQKLDGYGDNMDFGFYLGYTLSEQKAARLINNMSSVAILKETRSSTGYRNEVYNLCDKDITPGMSDDDIIALITPYNDGSYVELPEYVSLLSYLLLRDERYEVWTSMLVKLKYFPLQGALIRSLRTIDAYTAVLRKLQEPNVTHRKVLLHLMRDQYFRIVSDQPKTLERSLIYLSENRGKQYAELCQRYLSEFNDGIEAITQDVFTCLAEQLKLSGCSEWYSRKQTQYADGDKRFVAFEQNAVAMIGSALNELAKPSKWKLTDADINTLFYYIRQTSGLNITPLRSKLLIEALFDRLYINDSYYQFKLDPDTLDLLRLAYRCIMNSGLNPLKMLQLFNTSLDGYQHDYKQSAQVRRGDGFWFSMLLLGAGESEDAGLFDHYLGMLLRRVIGLASEANDYFHPLYIAEMVVTQVLMSEKNKFESFIISNIPHLSLVLTTLLANGGAMEQQVKEKLISRIDEEWDAEETLLKREKDSNLELLNEYIQRIRK